MVQRQREYDGDLRHLAPMRAFLREVCQENWQEEPADENLLLRLAQIVQEKGKTANDLKTYLTTQERTRLAQAVTDGKLTQAQADQRLADLPSRLDQLINRTGSAGGPFGPGPRGERGPGRGPGGAPGTPTARQ